MGSVCTVLLHVSYFTFHVFVKVCVAVLICWIGLLPCLEFIHLVRVCAQFFAVRKLYLPALVALKVLGGMNWLLWFVNK